MLPHDLVLELRVLPRKNAIEGRAQDRDRSSALFHGGPMRRGVDALREAAHYDDPVLCEDARKLLGATEPERCRIPRSHDRDARRRSQEFDATSHPEGRWSVLRLRLVQWPEKLGGSEPPNRWRALLRNGHLDLLRRRFQRSEVFPDARTIPRSVAKRTLPRRVLR